MRGDNGRGLTVTESGRELHVCNDADAFAEQGIARRRYMDDSMMSTGESTTVTLTRGFVKFCPLASLRGKSITHSDHTPALHNSLAMPISVGREEMPV